MPPVHSARRGARTGVGRVTDMASETPTALITGAGGGIGEAIAEAWRPITPCCSPGVRPGDWTHGRRPIGRKHLARWIPRPIPRASRRPPRCSPNWTCWCTTPGWPTRAASPESTVDQWRATLRGQRDRCGRADPRGTPRAARGPRTGGVHRSDPGCPSRPASPRTQRASSRCAPSPTRCGPTNHCCGSPAFTPAEWTPRCSATWWPTRAESTTRRDFFPPDGCAR